MAAWTALVSEGPAGLVYTTYANEGQSDAVHTVPDFSRAGYGGGGVAIPFVPAAVTISDGPGDDTALIQGAINQVSALSPGPDGFRGAVLLRAGEYTVSSTLQINTGGVVIRGEGQQNSGGTRITYTATNQSNLFHFNGSNGPDTVGGTTRTVTDNFVPVGTNTVTVNDATLFSPGDLIRLTNTVNQAWIEAIGMDLVNPAWAPSDFEPEFFRYVEAVDGNILTLDAPIMQAIESQYGGATVERLTYTGAIEQVGIENIRLESTYASNTDEDHGWRGIEMQRVRHGWVRQVTGRYFGMGLVFVDASSLFVTVEDSAMLDAKSRTTGGRKYSFHIDDASYNLVQRCLTRGGRHDYVTSSKTTGPNVFVDSLATQASNDIGPHFRYAVGELYDNIKTNHTIRVQNRFNIGTSHGWSGAQIMFWNVVAGGIVNDTPTGAMNWAVGAIGTKQQGEWVASEPFGIWESEGVPVEPRTLYYAQLKDRLGPAAVDAVRLPQQSGGTLWAELESWDGEGLFLDPVIPYADTSTSPGVDESVAINGRVRDLRMLDNLSSLSWSQVSGPGTVTFADSGSMATTVSFSASGQYTLQLLLSDGTRQVSGDLVVFVIDQSDTTAPAQPTGLTATPGYNHVSLDWIDNTEPDLRGYSVFRSETAGGVGAPVAVDLNASAFVDWTALNGTTYHYRVTGSDVNENESVASGEVAATPLDNDPAPTVAFLTPEAGVTIEAGSRLFVEVEATDLDGTIANVKLYLDGQLVRQESQAPYTSGEDTQNQRLKQNLLPGSYELEAVAEDNDGQTGSAPFILNVVADQIAPAAPVGLTAGPGDGVVRLDWSDNTDADVAGYAIYRRTTGGAFGDALIEGVLASSYQDTTVANGTTYDYAVSAIDTSGNESVLSQEVSVTPTDVIDFGTDSGKVIPANSGFTSTIPASGNESDLADTYRLASGADTGHENFAFLSNFPDMGGANRSDFVITMQARLASLGAGDKNNYRYGVALFSDASTLENGGIHALLWYDGGNMRMYLYNGLNDSELASGLLKDVGSDTAYPEGETYEFEVAGTYTDDSLDLSFTLSDGNVSETITATVDATAYAGTGFGGSARMRNEFTVDFDTFSIFTEGVDAAPAVPSGFLAAPGNNAVTLSWDDNPEPDLAGYTLYRSTTEGSYGTALEANLLSSAYTDTTAANGTTYYYVVTASDIGGNVSGLSEEVAVTPNDRLNVSVAATDNATARSNDAVQDNSENIHSKRNDFTGPNSRVAFIRFPLAGPNQLGGIVPAELDSVSLDVFITLNEPSDTLTVYGLYDGAQSSGTTLAETTWTGGSNGTEASGNNLQGSLRPDGAQSLPNAYTTGALGTLTFAAGTDTGLKQISLTDLAAFRSLVANDTNGEITLMIRGDKDSQVNQIASVFNSSGYPGPALSASGQAQDPPPSAPSGLAAVASSGAITLEWDDSAEPDLASYSIYRSEVAGDYGTAHATTLTDISYLDDSVTNGTTYFYVVTAVDDNGNESAAGSEVEATPRSDMDGDGISDLWETEYFPGEESEIDGSADSDGDGLADFFEYLFKTSPIDPSDFDTVIVGPNPAGDAVVFDWSVAEGMEIGTDYGIHFSDDLTAWEALPPAHYTLDSTTSGGRTHLQLDVTHDYGGDFFLMLVR